jgi:lambda repressor-like predicted transcriptional regulator
VAGATSAGVFVAAALVGCAIGVRRDLSRTPPKEVIFEDECHLQDHFDDVARGLERPPTLIQSGEIQKLEDSEKTLGGMSTYRFGEGTSLRTLRRVLAENWKPVPAAVMTAPEVDVQVRWSERIGTRWVVSNENVELFASGKEVSLAPHPCLTSLLFGQPLYERRRELLGLPSLPPYEPSSRSADAANRATVGDAGAPDRITAD